MKVKLRIPTLVACFVCALLALESMRAEEDTDSARESTLPEPVDPSAAVDTLVVPKGFRVELVAAEPLVRDPIAMEFDENGFAYVIELPPYNEHAKPGQKTNSSISRLADTDGDGRFDTRTTFTDELNYATGLFCYDGGLFVGDPPDLLYLRDTDGDGRADERQSILTGFGTAPAGESQLNSFRWGLDNRIHISTGLDGGEIVAASEPDAAPRNVRSRRLLLEPRTGMFELTSGGGQHGMSFDDWGRVYVCDNSRPIEVVFYDDRYIERNPHMSAPEAKLNIGPGANFTKLARISPAEAWRQIRSRLREEGAAVDDTHEPGRISGIFTSATGITIYRGDAWPAEYRGQAFVGEVANNLVYAARLQADGLSTVSRRATDDAEFMASIDTWCRPVQFAHGPDGNLYMLDMYRQLIEGVQWVPPEVLERMDPTAGSDRGRIYRIVPSEYRHDSQPVRLGEMPSKSLVRLLEHKNGWHRDTAARLLYERQDRRAVEPLRRLLAESQFPQGRLHALYALDGLDELKSADVLRALSDGHPGVREHAVRLAEQFAEDSDPLRQRLLAMTDDSEIRVRLQLAFSLGALRAPQRDPALLVLLRQDGENSWFRVAIQSSLALGAADFLRLVLDDESLRQLPHGQEFIAALAKQIGRGKDRNELAVVVAAIDTVHNNDEDSAPSLTKQIVVGLLADGAGVTASELSKLSHGRTKELIKDLLSNARSAALDDRLPAKSRLDAISILGCGSFSSGRNAFDELLSPQQPQTIQHSVLTTLGRFADAGVADLLLTKWAGFTPRLRASAAEVILSRPEWASSLLSAIERDEIARSDLDSARVDLLRKHPSAKVRERVAAVFSNSAAPRRAEVVTQYQRALELPGDVNRGRGVFQKSCSACHKLEGQGTAIGADLAAIRDRGPEAVLLNILDPNREIQPNFLTYVVITVDGRVITGLISEETPNELTLRQADGTVVTIARNEIDEMTSTGLSYMPEGLEQEIDQQGMSDLLAYLLSERGREPDAGSEE